MELSIINEEVMDGFDNIIFDLGGVIVGLDESLSKDAFSELIGLDSIAGTKYTKYFHDLEVGGISEEKFRAALRSAAEENSLPCPGDEELDYAWNKMILKIPHENIALLEKLKEQYNIYLLSNTNSIHLKYFIDNAFNEGCDFEKFEKLFVKTYYSHLIGARKPDKEAYSVVLKDAGLEPKKTLFIDDNAPNFSGAIELGISCYRIDRPLVDLGLLRK